MSNQNYWVLFELSEGSVKRVSLELMQKAASLAAQSGQKAAAVIIGEGAADAAPAAYANGADIAITVETKGAFEGTAYVLGKLIEKYQPLALLIGATPFGRDISAAVSAKADAGIAVDCTDVKPLEDGSGLSWLRPSYDGKLYADVHVTTYPQIGTFKTGIFKLEEGKEKPAGELIKEDIEVPASVLLTQFLGYTPDEALAQANIEDAEIIIAGGKGCGSQEEFDKLYELAALVGGNVGASRAAVEAGWVDKDRQIGIIGKTVTPKLYIGFGISGAVPHVNGMKNSDCIIAVNTDPNAGIFKYAHYGIVADLHVVVPQMIARFKALKG